MSRKKGRKRNKLPGHYCWACDRRRPNERFSGRGHARHLCKDCAKLGTEELAYRQAVRNLEKCMTWDGIIPRKRRKSFEHFMQHDDPRIRALAEEMQQEDQATRNQMRMDAELDELWEEETWEEEKEIWEETGQLEAMKRDEGAAAESAGENWTTEIPSPRRNVRI